MTHAELAAVATDMRRELPLVGRVEHVLNGRGRTPVYLRLQARYDRLQLTIGHRDHYPDPEQAAQIARLFGAADGEPLRENVLIASQDGRCLRVPSLVYAWFEQRN